MLCIVDIQVYMCAYILNFYVCVFHGVFESFNSTKGLYANVFIAHCCTL